MNGLQRSLICLIPPTVLVVLSVAVVCLKLPPSTLLAAVGSPLFTTTALAISILAFRRGEVGLQLAAGALLSAALAVLLVLRGNVFRDSWTLAALGFWYVAVVLSGLRIAKATSLGRLREFDRMLVVLVLPPTVLLTLTSLWFAAQVVQGTYDNYFYVFDGLLPLQLAHVVAQFCETHRWAWNGCAIVYYDFLLVFCTFIILLWRQDGEAAGRLMSRWIVATIVGYILYYWMPGVGPGVAFYGAHEPRFDSLPPPEQVELTLLWGVDGWPRNAMPSLHTTWALLVALASVEMKTGVRIFGAFYAAATVVATLGLREHYLIDLIVAVPFTVAVHAGMGLVERSADKKTQLVATLGGAAMTVGLLLVLRYGTAWLRGVPWVASCLVLTTLLASAWLIFRSEMERRRSWTSSPHEAHASTLTSTASRV